MSCQPISTPPCAISPSLDFYWCNPHRKFIHHFKISQWIAQQTHAFNCFLNSQKLTHSGMGKVYVGATDTTICPIRAVTGKSGEKEQLFRPSFHKRGEGKGWTNSMFQAALQDIMDALQLNKHHYNTHSFRIGAATSAQ